MKKFVFILTVVLMVVLFLNEVQTASAAMRNLMTEFMRAVENKNLEKVNSLLKEGLNFDDAANYTWAVIVKNIESISNKDEDFYISLISTTFEGKFKRKKLSVAPSSDKFLRALLKAGVVFERDVFPLPYWNLYMGAIDSLRAKKHIGENDKDLKRLRMLFDEFRDYKPGPGPGLAYYFLEGRGLDDPNNLTQENLDSMLLVFEILKGNDNWEFRSHAKNYLDSLRKRYRNIPDALKYIDKIDDVMARSKASSSGKTGDKTDSKYWWVVVIIGVLMSIFDKKKKK